MTLRSALPLLALLCVAVGCKKAPPEPEMHPVYGEVFAEFRGELTEDDMRRDEDESPVDYHDVDLVEGQNVFVRMEALTPFTTYLLIATPDRSGGHMNNNCMPGDLAASCYRFTAGQTGTYRLMANSGSEKDFGEYVLWVFSETDEEAAERMEKHRRDFAIATEQRRQAKYDELEGRIQEALRAHAEKAAANAENDDAPKADANAPAADAPTAAPVDGQDAVKP